MVCDYVWKDNFCIGIVAIWLRPTNRLGFGATMAITMAGAKRSGYGPRQSGKEDEEACYGHEKGGRREEGEGEGEK